MRALVVDGVEFAHELLDQDSTFGVALKDKLAVFQSVFLMPVFTDTAQTLKECREFADLMVAEPRKCCAFEANILQYNREDD